MRKVEHVSKVEGVRRKAGVMIDSVSGLRAGGLSAAIQKTQTLHGLALPANLEVLVIGT